MPRTSSQTIDSRIQLIISQAAREIADAVRGDIAAQVQGVLGGERAPRAPRRAAAVATAGRVAARTARTTAAKVTRSCPYPGCTQPSKGPRFSWFCAEHRNLPEAEKTRIKSQFANR